ncbi:hypothetical protein SAMN02745746_02105 [Pseudogulbenkiania subflava DSM 22618]|uniref:Uncharacterized protein n=1 Tax=Pseudogulbenkiania subflava DSM 22618 TaxID=1123014 RepID=A0A1Y6BYL5_9NEIS|nr:hypothetical protein SAMN02745746_02105 [Pseudogulbenkiania subflava DSM 22618]
MSIETPLGLNSCRAEMVLKIVPYLCHVLVLIGKNEVLCRMG